LKSETIHLTLVKRIYGAEISYSASQADKTFACDGNQLGDVGKLRWQPAFDTRKGSWAIVEHYAISIDCPNSPSPHSFRVKAFCAAERELAPFFPSMRPRVRGVLRGKRLTAGALTRFTPRGSRQTGR
jgi:hypothetical protein